MNLCLLYVFIFHVFKYLLFQRFIILLLFIIGALIFLEYNFILLGLKWLFRLRLNFFIVLFLNFF